MLNVFQYHVTPKELSNIDKVINYYISNPDDTGSSDDDVWHQPPLDILFAISGRVPSMESKIKTEARIAMSYITHALKKDPAWEYPNGRWPEAELNIMKDPLFAYDYAKDVIKGRWPEAESIIMKKPSAAFMYAMYIINGRWSEAEPYIMEDLFMALQYAKNVIKGRWHEAEEYIKNDWAVWDDYKQEFGVK